MGVRPVDMAAFERGLREQDRALFWPKAFARRSVAIPVFVVGRSNRCPDCHSEAFTVGRITADCGGCGLPLAIVNLRRVS